MLVAAYAFHSTATAYLNQYAGRWWSVYSQCLLCQNVYSQNVYCGKMSIVPKCLLWQNVDSQNGFFAKMSTVPKFPLTKCLLSMLNSEGPFGKEIWLIHKEFSRHFGILLKTLQPVLTVYTWVCFLENVWFLVYFTNCLLSYCPNYMHLTQQVSRKYWCQLKYTPGDKIHVNTM